MVYAGNALSYIRHPLGMIRKTGTGYVYDYCLTDHLGSTRVLLESSGNTLSAVQTTDYYPYGLAFTYANLMLNKYLYSGKELQDASLGGEILGLYDYGSRYYAPMLGAGSVRTPLCS